MVSPSDETDVDREFLVGYDYGVGGLWAVVIAPSAGAIFAKYPELLIASERPKWMSEDQFEDMRQSPLWLDDPPSGILRAVVADRDK